MLLHGENGEGVVVAFLIKEFLGVIKPVDIMRIEIEGCSFVIHFRRTQDWILPLGALDSTNAQR